MARRQNDVSGFVPSVGEYFPLPHISAGNLCDTLTIEGYDIRSYMDLSQWFRWYDVKGVTSAFNMPVDERRVLHLRTVEEALDLLRQSPDTYVMVESDTVEVPQALQHYRDRIIMVSNSGDKNPLAMTQEVFLRMLRWENQLNYLARGQEPLDTLLNVGASLFEGFMFVVGVDNNIIGYSSGVDFPNEEYARQMQQKKLLSTKVFADAFLTDEYCALSGFVAEVKDEYGSVCVAAPVRYEGSLFGFVVLVCGDRLQVTVGLKDQFAHFSLYALEKCSAKLKVGVERDLPHFYFLTALLRGDTFTRATIESNLARLSIPMRARYKVVVLNPRQSRLGTDVLTDAMRLLNDRKSFAVLFEDYVVAILYDNASDGALSHRKTLEDLEKYLYRPYGIVTGFSQVFEHISDVRLGYRQAVYALSNRDAIEVERSMMKEEEKLIGISFEMALPYYMIKENNVDREFHEFCMSHSPLETMLNADLENDTNNFLLLWLFLLYERNASVVGRRLYMHRNSVLYHIKQIEKRYDFDLDSWYAREKLLVDYRFLFLHLPDDILKRLFREG